MITADNVIGRNSGKVMRQNNCHSFAPSTRAASRNSSGMLRRPARNIAMQKPLICQTAAMPSEFRAVCVSVSHPDFRKSRCRVPRITLMP